MSFSLVLKKNFSLPVHVVAESIAHKTHGAVSFKTSWGPGTKD